MTMTILLGKNIVKDAGGNIDKALLEQADLYIAKIKLGELNE